MTAKSILLVEDSASDIYLTQQAVAECDRNIQLWTMRDWVRGPHVSTQRLSVNPRAHSGPHIL